jgi:hypothetical protein
MKLKSPAELQAEFAATAGLITPEQMHHMRVLWKKGRNMFVSFLTEAEKVKRQIGNDERFAEWCFWHLHISIRAITDLACCMQQDDADRVAAEFGDARKADKEKRAAEAHAAKLQKIARDNEIAAERAKNAELKAAAAKAKADAELAAKRQASKQRQRAKVENGEIKSLHDLTEEQRAYAAHHYFDLGETAMAIHGVLFDNPKPTRVSNKLAEFLGAEKARRERGGQPVDEAALYASYVVEGKTAAKHQWTLGDLAIQVSELKKVYGEKTLERYAEDIGVEFSTLQGYRWTAAAWPEKLGRPNFSVGHALAKHPDRVALVKADPYMRCEEAREIMRNYKESNPTVVNLRES